jgi:predicted outer membrane repeat protein
VKKLILGFALLFVAIPCEARIITVDDHGPASFNNIQAAIDDSNDGDVIIVKPGTYTGDGNRDINFWGKAITLRSKNGPENCIIDCQGSEAQPHRGFFFHNWEDSNSVLDGFTIRNGYDPVCGGGIVCSSGSPTIQNCIITNNRAGDDGGGIMCSVTSPTIRNCIITKNIAEDWEGGGIRCHACRGVILDNCLITENSARFGGGIGSSRDNSPPLGDVIVTNCTFSANSAQYGGGAVHVGDGSQPSIVNCILWGDTAMYGPEIAIQGFWPSAFLHVSFSDVQGGESDVFGHTLYWEIGNIDADPCFADPCNGDYHLKSQAGRWDANEGRWTKDEVTSLCIDAGNPGCPLGDEPNDVNNIRINMGGYGGTSEASKSPADWRSIADLTNDWAVDFNDLKVFVNYWLDTGQCIPGDLDRNQSIDFADFAIFGQQWSDTFAAEPSITYQIEDCNQEASGLFAAEQSSQTRFTATVKGNNIYFKDMMVANCCATELWLEMTVEGNLITICENEEGGFCFCICNYPVTATLGPFEPGTYILDVYEDYGGFIGTTVVTIGAAQ